MEVLDGSKDHVLKASIPRLSYRFYCVQAVVGTICKCDQITAGVIYDPLHIHGTPMNLSNLFDNDDQAFWCCH